MVASTIELEAVKQLGYTAVASIDESREAVRAAGRGLCIHEQLVAPTHNASASSGGEAADAADGSGGAGRCPVVVISKGANAVSSPAVVPQPQPQQQ